MLDDRGVVVGWNRRAQDLLGHPDTAVIGRPAIEVLVDPRDLPAVTEAAASCRRVGGWFGVLTLRHRDGRLLETGVSAPCALYTNGVIGERHIDTDTALTRLASQAVPGLVGGGGQDATWTASGKFRRCAIR